MAVGKNCEVYTYGMLDQYGGKCDRNCKGTFQLKNEALYVVPVPKFRRVEEGFDVSQTVLFIIKTKTQCKQLVVNSDSSSVKQQYFVFFLLFCLQLAQPIRLLLNYVGEDFEDLYYEQGDGNVFHVTAVFMTSLYLCTASCVGL